MADFQVYGLGLSVLGTFLLIFVDTPIHSLRSDGAQVFGTVESTTWKRIRQTIYWICFVSTIIAHSMMFLGFYLQYMAIKHERNEFTDAIIGLLEALPF